MCGGLREEYHDGGGWSDVNKYWIAHMRLTVIPKDCRFPGKESTPAYWGRDAFVETLRAAMWEHRVDPFMDYLEGLPPWDKVRRIDKWITDCYDATDSELTRWAARYYFMGAVTRTLHPGAKLDETPVLVGDKACGKSTGCRRWLPEPKFFGDNVTFQQDTKTQLEGMEGAVVIELAEMIGSTRAEVEALKAFVVRQYDKIRPAYGYQSEHFPRRCIFYGTANPGTPYPPTMTLPNGASSSSGSRSTAMGWRACGSTRTPTATNVGPKRSTASGPANPPAYQNAYSGSS